MTDPQPPASSQRKPRSAKPSINRMPEGSPFFERIVPVMLIVMGIVTTALILFAAGVLLGFIPFQ